MDRRNDILLKAGVLFKERGYHATSIRDIASALNLRGSSLYSHIQSKEELLSEIVNDAADTFLSRAAEAATITDPLTRLKQLIRYHLRVISDHLSSATVFFHEWKFLPLEQQSQITAKRDAYEKAFRDAIQEGIATGVFNVSDSKLATLFVLSSLNWVYQWFDPQGEYKLEPLTTEYTTLILSSLGAYHP